MTHGDSPPPAADAAPRHVGPYRILDTLGEGGMGTVFLAEQLQPVKRRVALKLIKLGMDSKAVVARFEQERQALALMQHDGIAKVFDCGVSDRGQPFFVMELVKGEPLTSYCDRHRLSLPQRIALMQQVCDAVQHAHQKGVVHRDLKPGNVLVTEDAGKQQIKIIDFGLAKAMGQKLVEATLFTEAGQVVGTPEYMAPEQADPSNQDIDTRADVYSLGAMLYEVLTGQLPFTTDELRKAGLMEMQRVLKETDPPKPSTKLSRVSESAAAIADLRRISVSALSKALKGDLDWLVLKALEKDRARRYETANALKIDLQRFLDHEPLVAGPPSAAYRLRKFARRYRRHLFSVALGALALIGSWFAAVNHQRNSEALARAENFALVRRLEAKEIAATEEALVVSRLWRTLESDATGRELAQCLLRWTLQPQLDGPCVQLPGDHRLRPSLTVGGIPQQEGQELRPTGFTFSWAWKVLGNGVDLVRGSENGEIATVGYRMSCDADFHEPRIGFYRTQLVSTLTLLRSGQAVCDPVVVVCDGPQVLITPQIPSEYPIAVTHDEQTAAIQKQLEAVMTGAGLFVGRLPDHRGLIAAGDVPLAMECVLMAKGTGVVLWRGLEAWGAVEAPRNIGVGNRFPDLPSGQVEFVLRMRHSREAALKAGFLAYLSMDVEVDVRRGW